MDMVCLFANPVLFATTKYIEEIRRNDKNSKAFFTHALQQISWADLFKMDSCSEQFHKFQSTMTDYLAPTCPATVNTSV